MFAANNAGERAKWQVLWVHDGRIIEKRFDDDFKAATDLYLKAKASGRKNVTLRCCNMGFPPPERLRPHVVEVKVLLDPPKIVRRNGKRYRKNFQLKKMLKVPLKGLNAEGIWWCPYCRELRRFKLTKSFLIDGIRIAETRHVCPMCGISHRDHWVRKYNPIALRLFYELEEAPRRRASRTTESRKREFKKKRRRKRE